MSGALPFTLLVAALALSSAVPPALRPSNRVGLWFNLEKNDKELAKALSFAIAEFNKKSNDDYGRKITSVTRAKKQMAHGFNYEADVTTGQTTCTKPIANIDECPLHESPEMLKRARCTFQVYTVPWRNKMEVKKSVCNQ